MNKCVFKEKVFPVTFHIKSGLSDPDFIKLSQCFQEFPKSIWIVKPGENSNRGTGIHIISSLAEIEAKLKLAEKEKKEDDEATIIV
jgi:predicted nuclease of predicted toxin-antitoxin system